MIEAVLDSPTVQRSRSFGFAKTVSKNFAFRVAPPQDGASRGQMDRCSGTGLAANCQSLIAAPITICTDFSFPGQVF